jgi:OPT oligopeptide transporter protein
VIISQLQALQRKSSLLYSFFVAHNNRLDNTGKAYDIKRILTPQFTLDVEAYLNYSPLYMPTLFAVCYGLSFATISAVLVHCWLYHGKEIVARFKNVKTDPKDVHARLYSVYKDVPFWWFPAMFILTVVIGILTVALFPLKEQLPVWAFLIAVLISIVFVLPVGIVQAITVSFVANSLECFI